LTAIESFYAIKNEGILMAMPLPLSDITKCSGSSHSLLLAIIAKAAPKF
jgi:hypothetical protein